jgi:hypothetical protein
VWHGHLIQQEMHVSVPMPANGYRGLLLNRIFTKEKQAKFCAILVLAHCYRPVFFAIIGFAYVLA